MLFLFKNSSLLIISFQKQFTHLGFVFHFVTTSHAEYINHYDPIFQLELYGTGLLLNVGVECDHTAKTQTGPHTDTSSVTNVKVQRVLHARNAVLYGLPRS